MSEALDFPLPPTTRPYLAGPPTSPRVQAPASGLSAPPAVAAPVPALSAPPAVAAPAPAVSAPPAVAAPAPALSAPPVAAVPVPAPATLEVDELTALRKKVEELDHVIGLAKTRVETLGAEKREALERALRLEAELQAAQQREAELIQRLASHESPRTFDETTVAELLTRVAALEALTTPSRAA
jgi:hypothetical protein